MESIAYFLDKNTFEILDVIELQDYELIHDEETNAKSISYKVKVARNDMGKVIGKQGKMARAIRSVMKAVATKEHTKVTIEFLD